MAWECFKPVAVLDVSTRGCLLILSMTVREVSIVISRWYILASSQYWQRREEIERLLELG